MAGFGLQLEGKTVLVTGGSRGIGRCIVEAFLDQGAHVFFCARTADTIKATVEELTPKGVISGATVDLSNEYQVKQWVEDTEKRAGRIDVVVSTVSALSVRNTVDDWSRTFETDMLGLVNLVNSMVPALAKSEGCIVAIGSTSGRQVDHTSPGPYGTFKAATTHFVSQLAYTLAPHKIRANTVSPGNIYTAQGTWGKYEKADPTFFKSQLQKNPMGRMGRPEEVANAVLFLASSRASFISGTNLLVDGALTHGVQL